MSKKMSRKEESLEERRLEIERFQREVFTHAQNLAAEMNLRMMLDEELGFGGEDSILFVESVIITTIAYPVQRRKSYFQRAKSLLRKICSMIHDKKKKR